MRQTDKDKTKKPRYRQFAGCDTLKARAKLNMMRDVGLLEMKGKGKAIYYVPGGRFPVAKHETTPPQAQTTPPQVQTTAPLSQTTAPLPVEVITAEEELEHIKTVTRDA